MTEKFLEEACKSKPAEAFFMSYVCNSIHLFHGYIGKMSIYCPHVVEKIWEIVAWGANKRR